jgi:hypothetical protein
MATPQRRRRTLRSLYPPEHVKQVAEAQQRDAYYLDDTLDAYPPLHLFRGPSTAEEIAAARAKAIERGLIPAAKAETPPDAPPDGRTARTAAPTRVVRRTASRRAKQ